MTVDMSLIKLKLVYSLLYAKTNRMQLTLIENEKILNAFIYFPSKIVIYLIKNIGTDNYYL